MDHFNSCDKASMVEMAVQEKNIAQGMNAEALRIILKDTKNLHIVQYPVGFTVIAFYSVDESPLDLVEDICDFTGWKNRNGKMGGREFNPEFAKGVIADFGKIVFGDGKRFIPIIDEINWASYLTMAQ
jgi:hypothetical protein